MARRKVAVVLLVAWLSLVIFGIFVFTQVEYDQGRAIRISQPNINSFTIPVEYTMELRVYGYLGIYAGEHLTISILIHGANITDLTKYFCCVGFLNAQSPLGFYLYPYGDVGYLPLNPVEGKPGEYQVTGMIGYQDPQPNAYAFLIPQNSSGVKITLSQIQQLPGMFSVDSESGLFTAETNTLVLGLTFILIGFGVLALQPIIDGVFPEKIRYGSKADKKTSEDKKAIKEIWLFGKIPEKETPSAISVNPKPGNEEKKTTESKVKKEIGTPQQPASQEPSNRSEDTPEPSKEI